VTWVLLSLLALLGLAVGSFLNVVIHRVPAGASVVRPPSSCPGCGSRIRTRDNVPVLSWLLLRGRCRSCRRPIPARYPAVELLTALLFVAAGARFGPSLVLVAALVLLAAGVALAAIDLQHQRLPFAITGVTAVAVVAVIGADTVLGAGAGSLPRAAASAAAWLGVYGGVWLLTAGRGMGLGDVALAPVLGVVLGWLGWGPSLVALLGGFVIGALVGAVLLAGGRATRRARVPHGPFMLAGAAVGLFAGQALWHAYLGAVGLA
jgi:leader peptidase (prepilin peptidase) / N-methyltransferase